MKLLQETHKMDQESQEKLARMIFNQRVASLGTLREGTPLVSLVLFTPAPDFSCFYFLASQLAQHTQDIQNDPHISLMIAETDLEKQDPQTLARLSIRGLAAVVSEQDKDYIRARNAYLRKFPDSEQLFGFKDFSLYRLTPVTARYVAGFARAFNLVPQDLVKAANTQSK
jgi:putative heme iron utilization protein